MEPNTSGYNDKNLMLKIERIFIGDKTIKELFLELLLKKAE